MDSKQLTTTQNLALLSGPLPRLIAQVGPAAVKATANFFTAEIENRHTARAYGRAVARFCRWCDQQGLSLDQLEPYIIATYMKQLREEMAITSVKQHLAGLKHYFDHLATEHVLRVNPAAAVRGPKHKVTKGKTPVLVPEETYQLIRSIDLRSIAGLRDRALIAVMYYSFARIGAVLGDEHDENPGKGMRIGDDYYARGKTWYFRLLEKGNQYLERPAHHKAVECVDAYLDAAGIADQVHTPLFRALDNHRQLTDRPLRPRKALQMIKRRAGQAGLSPKLCNHSFRGMGITDYLSNGGLLEEAQKMAGHASARTTKLYDRRSDELSIDEVEKMPSFDARPVA